MGRDSREWVSGLTAYKTPPYLVLIKLTFNDIDNIFVSSNNSKQSSVILQLDWPDADQKISPLAMNTL